VGVRLLPAELEAIQARAAAAGRLVSAYLRDLALGAITPAPADGPAIAAAGSAPDDTSRVSAAPQRHPPLRAGGCWLCGGLGGIAIHITWTEARGNGKPLWTAHEYPSDDAHPVEPCPVCAAPSSPESPIVHAATERAIQRMRTAEGEVFTLRTELASAQNAIGQVLRKAGSWQMQGGGLDAVAVARWLTDTLGPWTGQGRDSSANSGFSGGLRLKVQPGPQDV
jgi:hypothetical protein